VDEDEQGEHVSRERCSKSPLKFSGQKKNDGQVKYTFFNPLLSLLLCLSIGLSVLDTYGGIVNAATHE
jgi:hypothetical protein